MKRIAKKKLALDKQTVRALIQPLESKTLQGVVGGCGDESWGSLVGCQTRDA